jgi:hypothetical protein
MRPAIDDSGWPLVRIRYGSELTIEDILYLAERVEGIFRQRGPMVTMADIGAVSLKATTAARRRLLAEEADRLAAMHSFIAEAVIIPNPVLRVVYASYVWARRRLNHPYACFSEESAALAWAHSFLKARDVAACTRSAPRRACDRGSRPGS